MTHPDTQIEYGFFNNEILVVGAYERILPPEFMVGLDEVVVHHVDQNDSWELIP